MKSIGIEDLNDDKNKSSVINTDDLAPIEMKSNAHIERAIEQEKRQEIVRVAGSAAKEVFDWLESILIGILAIVVIFTFFVRVNTVSGRSMLPTLVSGQKLIVSDLFYTPAYNDIVIIQASELPDENGEKGKPIVKRIIGMPGDKIYIDFVNGIVYRNDVALEITVNEEDGLLYEDGHKINTLTKDPEDMTGEVIVPEDCYFVMGDNRNSSTDSRNLYVGCVHKNYIAGKVLFSIFPFDKFGSVN